MESRQTSSDEPRRPPAIAAEDKLPILVRKHLRFGWAAILGFLMLGMILEGLHAFKVGDYLNPSMATRRLMWTLAHAHGTLLGMLNVAFAFSLGFMAASRVAKARWASSLLRSATLLLPLGFLLGGASVAGGDPGLGIALVPLGAALLLLSVVLTLAALRE